MTNIIDYKKEYKDFFIENKSKYNWLSVIRLADNRNLCLGF